MQVAIVGCGWLGTPLAHQLKKSGHQVVATRRSKQGVKTLVELGFTAVKYELGDDLSAPDFNMIFQSDLLILNIPVGRKSNAPDDFVQHMRTFIQQAKLSQIKHVVFISTTSVYGDSTRVVTEKSAPEPVTQSAKINWAIEQDVAKSFQDKATIFRLAGLVGEARHPAKFLAGKLGLANPKQVVNLVHQDDVILAIEKVIKKGVWGETLVLSALAHPSRQDYYTWAAEQYHLAAPSFVAAKCDETPGKRVDATSSLAKLGLALTYPSPFDMI